MKKIPKLPRKYIGWGGVFSREKTKMMVIVSAKSKKQAEDTLNHFNFKIVDNTQIRHVCIVKYPGPRVVQVLRAQNWNDCIKIVEDKEEFLK